MDAKVFRAAVLAAMRVTVSTALVGCGNTVTKPGGAAPADEGVERAGSSAGERTPVLDAATAGSGAKPSAMSGSGASAGPPASGGATAAEGSTTMAGRTGLDGGAGGTPDDGAAGAGSPALVCGGDALACLSLLEGLEPAAPLDDAGSACCLSVRKALLELPAADAECYRDLSSRFQKAPGRSTCCADPSTWLEIACTPWGPPVPPELSPSLLASWAAVA